MQKEDSSWKHQKKNAQLPCSEDASTKLEHPLPKVGTLRQVTYSETSSRGGMQSRKGAFLHKSRLARLPCIHENDAMPRTWSPQQPKVGPWNPERARRGITGQREADKVQESNSCQPQVLNDSASDEVSDPADVKQDSDTDSAASDIEEDVQILIGGLDETKAWRYMEEHGGWSRETITSCSAVRLSDMQALPRGSTGELLSFGSLGHMLHGERCKPCIFHQRGSCRRKSLCTFCHAAHKLRARQPKKRRRDQIGSGITKSDSQGGMTNAVLGRHSPPSLVALALRDAALVVFVMVLLLAILSLFFDHSLALPSTS